MRLTSDREWFSVVLSKRFAVEEILRAVALATGVSEDCVGWYSSSYTGETANLDGKDLAILLYERQFDQSYPLYVTHVVALTDAGRGRGGMATIGRFCAALDCEGVTGGLEKDAPPNLLVLVKGVNDFQLIEVEDRDDEQMVIRQYLEPLTLDEA